VSPKVRNQTGKRRFGEETLRRSQEQTCGFECATAVSTTRSSTSPTLPWSLKLAKTTTVQLLHPLCHQAAVNSGNSRLKADGKAPTCAPPAPSKPLSPSSPILHRLNQPGGDNLQETRLRNVKACKRKTGTVCCSLIEGAAVSALAARGGLPSFLK